MYSEFIECFPAKIIFKEKMPSEGAQDVYERVLRKALLFLTSKTNFGNKVNEFM